MIKTIVTILTCVFIYLKAANLIDWPWLWVLSPAWIGWILELWFIIFMAIITFIVELDE